ncbi:MAG TPA: DUF3078 domain-containing protein [Bacteroidales bacterium]|nr:DUF3078 domain-containing protein [Bacteroidales bacterium]
MIKFLCLFAIVSLSITALAQNEPESPNGEWKRGGVFSLSFTQLTLHNWIAGGENSMSGTSFLNLYANFSKNKMTWDNTLDLGYGLLKQGKRGFIKSDDKLEVSSKYGRYAFKHWYYSGLLGFKTQFAPGYRNPEDSLIISDFLSPAYINAAIGMDFKPNDNLSVFISPLAGKATIVTSDSLSSIGAYGVEAGKIFRSEFGGYIKVIYKADIMKNVSFSTKLDLFSNYLNKPQNIDVNWDNLLALKINDYLSANVQFLLMYDDDIHIGVDTDDDGQPDKYGPRVQLKEMFGAGLMYKF